MENSPAKIGILIVDDQDYMRKLVLQFLSNNASVAVVGEASNGDEAIREAQGKKPDVILLDMSMPHTSGVEVARKIRSLIPEARIYFFSAYDLEDFKNLVHNAPADGFVKKSSLKKDLYQMIQTELERKKI